MGQYNPLMLNLKAAVAKMFEEGQYWKALEAVCSLPFGFLFSLVICALFGVVIATRGVGVLFYQSNFRRTKVESERGAELALLSNQLSLAEHYTSELDKTHHLKTVLIIQARINEFEFEKAISEIPLLVRRERHALGLDEQILLDVREQWFILASRIAILDIPRLWVAFVVWSIGQSYLTKTDLATALANRLALHGKDELEAELQYVLAVAFERGMKTTLVEWLIAMREQISRPLGAMPTPSDVPQTSDQISERALCGVANIAHLTTILKSRAFRSMPNDWDEVAIFPILRANNLVDLVEIILQRFESAATLE
jgi:hypothetical protein